jgi:Zn-dependent protease
MNPEPSTPLEDITAPLRAVTVVEHRSLRRISTSTTEITHLLIAWLAISYAFAILLLRHKIQAQPTLQQVTGGVIIDLLALSLITVGISFLLHELAHKIVAQRYGAWAEFRMSPMMLIFSILLAYEVGIIFAAPGAVMIYGTHVTTQQNGRISLAGPLTNLFLLFVFLPFMGSGGFIGSAGRIGVMINAALAMFNMFPVSVLDGHKIWNWSKPMYMISAGAILLTVLGVYAEYFT